MNFPFKKSILTILFTGFCFSSVSSLTKKEVIGYSIAATAGAAVLTGAYLFLASDDDSLDNIEIVDKNGEKVLQEKKVEKKKVKQVIADVLKFMIVPSAVGLGAYWFLVQYTPEGKLKNLQARRNKISLGLGEKFSDGKNALSFEQDLSNEGLLNLVNSNFGKNTQCPLVEAEKYLREQKERLQEQLKLLNKEDSAKTFTDELNIHFLFVKTLSDKISRALDLIQHQTAYQEQLKRYDSLEKDRVQREELSAQKKHEYAKIFLIIAGVSGIAGKIVAPFVGG
jgi:hypothetical protein